MSALTFTGIRKTFDSNVALEHFDLDIKEGELISLLGPSGCGKTTVLRIAAGFEVADSGTVSVAGTDITHLSAHKRNMGMVFQSYSLFPNLTVELNVDYGLRTRKIARAERERRVKEILELVQLDAMASRYPHQLSGGQQQRVALARALAVQPRVLLLDEPLSALDAKVRASLRAEIRRIQTEVGITTLFVTHDQEEALGISDRVGVMSNGRLEQLATPLDVYRNPASAFVARFVGSMNELPGMVTEHGMVDIAGYKVATADGLSVDAGANVMLLVRPEDLAVTASTEIGLPGTVTASTFQGASTEISVRLDRLDRLVTSSMASAVAPVVAVGQRVGISVDARRAVWEPAQSSMNGP
ncbi:MAG: ABC transporter ATP-binding protein [Acidimicrobiales bacterium]